MTENNDKADQLLGKLDALLKRQEDFSREIIKLRSEINQLKYPVQEQILPAIPEKETDAAITLAEEKIPLPEIPQEKAKSPRIPDPKFIDTSKVKSDFEKFIGENLINKIGIGITVIGVGIGVKYSIEHELISPLTRIILGYLMGIGLMGFGMKLKKNYENFSAILVSGAIAIMYFMTYAAYGIYSLIPQTLAFVLMLIFTAFTVLAATKYNKQVIAHIGLVGAYAVPFLLSEGSGKVWILFTYMAIINAGILILSLKKYWKPLYYSSFILTWLIVLSWFVNKYESGDYFTTALVFSTVFFVIFYVTFIAYKLLKKEVFDFSDIILLLANSFLFYGLGYVIINDQTGGEKWLGVFTLANAVVHFLVSVVIYKQKLADKNLFYLVSGLVLVFITITIPVQLDGNWVTLIWAAEAALLFWIGRTKDVSFYENLSSVLMMIAFGSLVHDWMSAYGPQLANPENKIKPLFNVSFLSSLVFIAAFAFINSINYKRPLKLPARGLSEIMYFLIPAILLVSLYAAFYLEIANYWNSLYTDSALSPSKDGRKFHYWNEALTEFKSIWLIIYSLFFVIVLSLFNMGKLKSLQLGWINLGLNLVMIVLFLTYGLLTLSELREIYLGQTLSEYYQRGSFYIWIRYVSYIFFALALWVSYRYILQDFMRGNFKTGFDFVFYTSVLWIASSELVHLMDMAASTQSYKLGLSILWGLYALTLIALGIWKRKKHLRIGAIALFGITLVKLFFYDIADLDTIAKTVVFVSLGILLLIISFLYNKYKNIIGDEKEE
jgi:uncharacterized membrane protein